MNPPGATLGDMLARARREAGAFSAWLEVADPALAARIASHCASDEPPASFVRSAVASFGYDASDADWSQLVSAARAATDPATATLGVIVQWRLSHAATP